MVLFFMHQLLEEVYIDQNLNDNKLKVLAIHPGWVRTDMGRKESPVLPHKSAKKVFNLILKKWNISDSIYYDLDGKEMDW